MPTRRARSTLSLVASTALAIGCAPPAAAPGTLAFVDVAVLPMDREGVLEGQTVVVVDGVIAEVGPAGQVEVGTGATILDGSGRYLMPGLAEMHAHVPPGDDGEPGDPLAERVGRVASGSREAVEDILFLYVANGITTIRGMLGSAYQIPLADELERGEVLGPTFYVAAPSLNGNTAPTPEAAERLVRAHAAAGYDLQKIHPGVPLPAWDHMVGVASEVGLTFGGHVPADVGLVHAITTGMSTVDHLDGYVQAVAPPGVVSQINAGEIDLGGLLEEGVDQGRIDEIVRLTVDEDVYVVPTMYLWENLYGTTDAEPFLAQPEMRFVSATQREAWRRQAAGGALGTPEELEVFFALRKRILKALADAGAGILMGTDSPQLFNVPGFALHREIAMMAEAGMTHHQILLSGTASVGRYVREHLCLDQQFGLVAPGQRADLVLLGSNPLDDLDNLTDRVGVMVRGRWIPRAELDAGLEALAAKHLGGGE